MAQSNQMINPLQQATQQLADGLARFDAARKTLPDLLQDLDHLRKVMQDHVASVEDPSGLFGILKDPGQETVPTLLHRVGAIRHEHISLFSLTTRLHKQVRRTMQKASPAPAKHSSAKFIRKWGKELVQRLKKHGQEENKLLMDTLNTDVGVGD